MERPLLSIGMIVKNEIRCLEKCLKALQPLREAIPCQLVIADTGSDDGTREVAQRYADILFDFPWINDFAAARNAVLDRCTGKWALTVDADEYLDADFAELVKFLTGPEQKQFNWACVSIVNYSDREMKGDGIDFLAARLAKLAAHPRYEGTIHEYLSLPKAGSAKALFEVRFHHDGYAQDSKHPERALQKQKRNLALLDQELEKEPGNLKALMQCQESSSLFPDKQIAYCRRGMEALDGQYSSPAGKSWGPVVVCHALETAVRQKMPELEQWRKIAETKYPDSLSIRLDATFALMQYYAKERDYQQVPALAQRFLTAWKDFQDKNFDINVLTRTIYRRTPRQYEVLARVAGGEALARLGRTEEAARLLMGEPDWDGLKPIELRTFLVGSGWAAGEEALQHFVAQGAETVRAMTGDQSAGMWESFCTAANEAFRKRDADEDAPTEAWRLYARVCGGLGQAARIMGGDAADIQALLPEIKAADWADVPGPAVVRAVELGVELPDGFFTQSRERLGELTVQLSDSLPLSALLDWAQRWDFTGSITRFQFLLELLAACMRADKTWDEQQGEDRRDDLCRRFLEVAEDYLPNYYHPQLLADESEWPALPGLHRFALHLIQSRRALQSGDELGCVRALRAALKAAPAMKKAVAFLKEKVPEPSPACEPAPELLALAAQVRGILARYPAGDPAVAALKQSEAYRKVAYLIEGPEDQARGQLPRSGRDMT